MLGTFSDTRLLDGFSGVLANISLAGCFALRGGADAIKMNMVAMVRIRVTKYEYLSRFNSSVYEVSNLVSLCLGGCLATAFPSFLPANRSRGLLCRVTSDDVFQWLERWKRKNKKKRKRTKKWLSTEMLRLGENICQLSSLPDS